MIYMFSFLYFAPKERKSQKYMQQDQFPLLSLKLVMCFLCKYQKYSFYAKTQFNAVVNLAPSGNKEVLVELEPVGN